MKPTLQIFVSEHCPGCDEAQVVATHLNQTYPQLKVEVVDINAPHAIVPEAVFATPTYMLDNRIVSLGNPSLAEIIQWIERIIG